MKRVAIVVMLLAAATSVVWQWAGAGRRPRVDVAVRPCEPAPTSRSTEPEEVFRRAFWRRPTAGDRILHAERREWADGEGVQKWQWFLVVEPSPELLGRLRDDNVFDLLPQKEPPALQQAPDWFRIPTSGVEFMGSATGGFRLVLEENGQRIYATDSGLGFRSGMPEPARHASPLPEAARRLPDSMPPQPAPQSR